MRTTIICTLLSGLALGATAFAGESDKKVIAPPTPLDDSWRFSLSVPGWIPWLQGDEGLNGKTSHVALGPNDIIPKIDMAADVRAEAHKGRLSVMGEFLYMSLSDGVGSNTVVQKVDVRVDQTMADLGFGWRLIDSPRGYLDVTAGVRYTNYYQRLTLQPNSRRINEVSTELVDTVGDRLRTALSESGLNDLIKDRLARRLSALADRKPTLPIPPLADGEPGPIRDRIRQIIDAKKAELVSAIRDRVTAATDALRARAQARIDGIKTDLSRKIATILESKLDRSFARTDDWWDPYVGLRGRYNLNEKFYLTAKGDIGGFGVGSELSWTAEAALGYQLSRNLFTEVGYRALGVDYEKDGLTMKTVTHGPQVTLGIVF